MNTARVPLRWYLSSSRSGTPPGAIGSGGRACACNSFEASSMHTSGSSALSGSA
jgi:hypothetical protein